MTGVFVCGLGAVSPAGWGVPALRDALGKGTPLPAETLPRPAGGKPLRARLVPPPVARPGFLAHPRLRRTSLITHYAAAAALEAISRLRQTRHGSSDRSAAVFGRAAAAAEVPGTKAAVCRLGIITCLQAGCVNYSCRFFEEALKNPATASPLLFPETIFAAPASHTAAILGNVARVDTLVGDPAGFLQGLALGARWLNANQVDACLVIGTEETNWLVADALSCFEHSAITSGGAGALCLCRDPKLSIGVELNAITDAHTYSPHQDRAQAAKAMRRQLGGCAPSELLCDGLNDSPRADGPELMAWSDWPGLRLSPKRILGEGLMAAAAWQCVAAADAVATGQALAATVSLVGSNQQAIGARFVCAA